MKITTNGLVLKEQHVGESDRLVTILTREMGLVRAFVPGARSIKGKRQAATQLLAYGNFTLSENKGVYRVTEAECLDVFFHLRSDLIKLSLAQYWCELCHAVAPESDEAGIFLRVMLNCLKFLEQDKLPPAQLKSVAELSFLTLGGYMPNVEACHICQTTQSPLYFDPVEGVVVCGQHRTPRSICVSLGVLQAMIHITHSTVDKLFSFSLSLDGLEQLSRVSEEFVLAQLDRTFKTLEFYHSL